MSDLNKLIERYPEVQLATLVEQPPEGKGWLHEIKLDGYRLLGFVAGGDVCLRTRNGKDWTAKFPSLASRIETLKVTDAVLDMEAVALTDDGKSSFQTLQVALGEGGDPNAIVAYVFDLLHLAGKDLTGQPLRERKQKLQKLLSGEKSAAVLRYSEHVEGSGNEMFAKACSVGLEGIVSKEAEARYLPGRQKSWLKSKCAQRQEFIIIGYSDPRKGERALGALYLGYHQNGAMQYAGKVGTGFSMKGARALTDRLKKLALKKPVLARAETVNLAAREWDSIHWVKPNCSARWHSPNGRKMANFATHHFRDCVKTRMRLTSERKTLCPKKLPKSHYQKNRRRLFCTAFKLPIRTASSLKLGITKGDLASYYAAMARYMLPQLLRHPLSLLRCPAGIDGQCFYQRNPGRGLGPDVHPFEFKNKGKSYEYLYLEDAKGLLELVQMGAIEIHPWGASIDAIDCPSWMIFDLDPAPEVPFEALKLAAQDLRGRLRRRGLESTLKCTGGKGLHVTVQLAGKDKWPDVKAFAASIAREMVAAAPEAYIATMSKAKRNGKIFIDYFRNDYTATAIADYSIRARQGAPVALPLDWKELNALKSASQFGMKDVLKRLERKKPAAGSEGQKQRIPPS